MRCFVLGFEKWQKNKPFFGLFELSCKIIHMYRRITNKSDGQAFLEAAKMNSPNTFQNHPELPKNKIWLNMDNFVKKI